uniref:Spectrin beta chain n=1 Tax=Brugia timori TaxID=42155 RepID=A0A0R3QH41_9BILA
LCNTVIESLQKLEISWKQLAERATARGQALMASGELHKFLDAMRKAEIWAVDALSRLTTAESPRSVTDADAFIARHVEKLAEIDGRQREISELREWSTRLIAKQSDHKGEIQRAIKRLQNVEHQLRQAWEARNVALARARNRQLFADQAARAEQWLASKEAFLKQVTIPFLVETFVIFVQANKCCIKCFAKFLVLLFNILLSSSHTCFTNYF